MPGRIPHVYIHFQEALQVRNTIAGELGEAYRKPTSIPQGDPMSIMVTSLLLRAWVVQMQRSAVKPMLCADDLHLLCAGSKRWEHFEYGFNTTHKHLIEMGAKLAPKKWIVFSSDETSRCSLHLCASCSAALPCGFSARGSQRVRKQGSTGKLEGDAGRGAVYKAHAPRAHRPWLKRHQVSVPRAGTSAHTGMCVVGPGG